MCIWAHCLVLFQILMSCLQSAMRLLNAASCQSFKTSRHSTHKLMEAYQCKYNSTIESLILPSNFNILYCHTEKQCVNACKTLVSDLKPPVVIGFDAEWIPFEPNKKVAVIQLCTSLHTCYIFHLSQIGFIPPILLDIIMHRWVVKVGVGVEFDLDKLFNDYFLPGQVDFSSHIDIGKYATDLGFKKYNNPNWSLKNLTKLFLKKEIDKNFKIRLGNWEEFPLTKEQLDYAAVDAYASMLLFNVLDKHRRMRNKPVSSFPYLATKLKKD